MLNLVNKMLQDPISRSRRYDIVVPGSEIPTWFTKHSSGQSMTAKRASVQMTQNLSPTRCNEKWMGFALSLCFRNVGPDKIFCDIKINGQKWGFGSILCPAESETSDHLWLFYLPRGLYFHTDWQNSRVILFSFYTNSYEPEYPVSPCGPCGVCLVYQKDMEAVDPN